MYMPFRQGLGTFFLLNLTIDLTTSNRGGRKLKVAGTRFHYLQVNHIFDEMEKVSSVISLSNFGTASTCSQNSNGLSFPHVKARPSASADGHHEEGEVHQSAGSSKTNTKCEFKTMCFAKKSLTMPTKEDHLWLLNSGLGKSNSPGN